MFDELSSVATTDAEGARVTSDERQTPKGEMTVQSSAGTQAPSSRSDEDGQLRQSLADEPEHVAQELEHEVQAPEEESQNWDVDEHVSAQVPADVNTGRAGGHEMHLSNAPSHVSQSG